MGDYYFVEQVQDVQVQDQILYMSRSRNELIFKCDTAKAASIMRPEEIIRTQLMVCF